MLTVRAEGSRAARRGAGEKKEQESGGGAGEG